VPTIGYKANLEIVSFRNFENLTELRMECWFSTGKDDSSDAHYFTRLLFDLV